MPPIETPTTSTPAAPVAPAVHDTRGLAGGAPAVVTPAAPTPGVFDPRLLSDAAAEGVRAAFAAEGLTIKEVADRSRQAAQLHARAQEMDRQNTRDLNNDRAGRDEGFRSYVDTFHLQGLAFGDDPRAINGLRFCRVLRAATISQKRDGSRSIEGICRVLEGFEGFGTKADKHLATDLRSMSAGDFAAGGALVPPQLSTELIDFLRPMTVVESSPGVTTVTIDRPLPYPKLTSEPDGAWGEENELIALEQYGTGTVKLNPAKYRIRVQASNEWMRMPGIGGEQIIRNALAGKAAMERDRAHIRGSGVDSQPAGLRYQASNVTADTGTSVANLMTQLVNAMVRMMTNSAMGNGMSVAWLLSPRTWGTYYGALDTNNQPAFRNEMQNGTLLSFKVRPPTPLIPVNLGGGANESEIYLVNFADVVVGNSPRSMEVEISEHVAFGNDATQLRLVDYTDVLAAHQESVEVISEVAA